ncbi:hypothetical protein DIPPA_17838 [Diplonema papillatum]|nr:hypothetical protein DIPPA_17838 [Diplonema papillatum]
MGGYAVTININLRDKRRKKKKKKKTDQAAPSQSAAGREGSAAAGMPGTLQGAPPPLVYRRWSWL